MVSPIGDQTEPQDSNPASFSNVGKPKADWMNQIDTELAFRLIDTILPFEACLYHQVLPLSLEGSRLKLGMVNTDDSAALDYVRRILAYMNCSLVPHALASDIHYAALSAYLSHSGKQNKTIQPVARRIAAKLAEQSAKQVAEAKNVHKTPQHQDHSQDPHTSPTLVVDSPTELPLSLIGSQNSSPPAEPLSQPAQLNNSAQGTTTYSNPSIDATPSTGTPPVLAIYPQHLSDPPEVLAALSSNTLLRELLARVLSWGFGRLFLERQSKHGRVVWSENGVQQAVLEELPIKTFQGIIDELKAMTNLPLAPAQKIKQVEIERLYQQKRLLLRLRLIPGKHGEEAMLQILRGAALKFYQQHQLVDLGQEALSIAQQLQAKVSELYTYSHTHATPLPEHLSILPELDRVLKHVGYQLNELKSIKANESAEEK
ncbi:MAG: hypothetical protein HC866_01020 [Leptolyngbyaceae cyanobacterium RU_5_1]|nr:hypothetical protein [Leptolyngbyaceae cyanobacterium RU_5_1]